MHFLFIYPSSGVLGGIETLIARMSRYLTNNGHKVSLLIDESKNWVELLPKEVRCFPLGERFPELYYYYHAKRLWDSLRIPKPDVIKSFDIGSSWIACQLATLTGNKCKVISGIYNPYVFKHYYATNSLAFWDARKVYVDNFLENIPSSARFFCGADQLEELEQVHRQRGMLWPLPIDRNEFDAASRKPVWGKIVSVGRLSPMKEYNLYMIDIVRNLVRKGHKITWSVYGAGEYETAMRERIKIHHLENVISLRGTVPYRLFRRVLEEAYVFVGMGTAILEASLFKVPNVSAVAYDREGVTYGPVYRLPRGSIGQVSTSPPVLSVADEIERILRLSSSEYRAEENLVYNHVQDHEIEASMNQFVQLALEAGPITRRRSLYLANYLFWFVRRAMKSRRNDQGVRHPNALVSPAGAKTSV